MSRPMYSAMFAAVVVGRATRPFFSHQAAKRSRVESRLMRVLRAPRFSVRSFTRAETMKSFSVKVGCSSTRGGSSPSARIVSRVMR
ncbi:hypothetical protein AB0F13_27550 [Streptomyces sp. NPDC026206]|uniref:hypothetical protein n=1 Tax=Streptomyces sp. NPDC026206 TaxID=3157089 RepID=UPI003402A336